MFIHCNTKLINLREGNERSPLFLYCLSHPPMLFGGFAPPAARQTSAVFFMYYAPQSFSLLIGISTTKDSLFSKNGENLHKMKKKCNKGELLNDYTPFSAKSDKTVAGRARGLTYPSRVEANPHRARLCLSGLCHCHNTFNSQSHFSPNRAWPAIESE